MCGALVHPAERKKAYPFFKEYRRSAGTRWNEPAVNLILTETEPTMRAAKRRRFVAHLRRSLPSLTTALVGSVCWALVMAASAVVAVWRDGWETDAKIATIALLFGAGAALAFPVGLTLARFASSGKSAERRFAAYFLGLALSTIGFTAAIYALDYRQYYSAWHEEMFSITWMFQLLFTGAVAVIQFAVLGVRLFFPLGFAALFVASLWFARSAR
jgi:hypothetical protein